MNPPNTLEGRKTLIVNTLFIVAGFYPPLGALVQAYPTETLQLVGVLNIALRFFTKGKVRLPGV
jgi:hypothetical protein